MNSFSMHSVSAPSNHSLPLPQEKNSPEGNEGPARRFVKFGGGLGEEQLEWLEATLHDAQQQGQRCLCFCHLPVRRQISQDHDLDHCALHMEQSQHHMHRAGKMCN